MQQPATRAAQPRRSEQPPAGKASSRSAGAAAILSHCAASGPGIQSQRRGSRRPLPLRRQQATPRTFPCTLCRQVCCGQTDVNTCCGVRQEGRTLRHQRQLGGKPLHVVCLFLQEGQGDELREVGVLVAGLLEGLVQVGLQGKGGINRWETGEKAAVGAQQGLCSWWPACRTPCLGPPCTAVWRVLSPNAAPCLPARPPRRTCTPSQMA